MVGLGHLNESQFEKEVKLRFSFRPQAFRFKASAHGAVRWLTYQQPAEPFVPMKTGRSNSRSRRSEDATLTDRPREDQHDRGVGMIHARTHALHLLEREFKRFEKVAELTFGRHLGVFSPLGSFANPENVLNVHHFLIAYSFEISILPTDRKPYRAQNEITSRTFISTCLSLEELVLHCF